MTHPGGGDGALADRPPPRTRVNSLAIASVIASAVSLCGVGSLVGVALGVVALNQPHVRGERGRWLALAGIGLGAVTLLASMIVVVKVFVDR